MKPIDKALARDIDKKITLFAKRHNLLGIAVRSRRDSFIEQIIDSIRRIKYIAVIRDREREAKVTDPTNSYFDPLVAAAWHRKNGNLNEAFWLIFLAIHFGKNKKTKWELMRNIYKGDSKGPWTWDRVTSKLNLFLHWLSKNGAVLKTKGNFGNHRKYESLNSVTRGTGATIESYINWVGPKGDHIFCFKKIQEDIGCNDQELFDHVYKSMNVVQRFGRMAKFDYLTMIGKMGLCPIEPTSVYMDGATGPYIGGNLLFKNNANAGMDSSTLDALLKELADHLDIPFSMQVLEDAVCNWQKSPDKYIHFRG